MKKDRLQYLNEISKIIEIPMDEKSPYNLGWKQLLKVYTVVEGCSISIEILDNTMPQLRDKIYKTFGVKEGTYNTQYPFKMPFICELSETLNALLDSGVENE